MKTIQPDYYEDFHCAADRCAHSCCVGWEIDIDEDTFAYYSRMNGKIGEELRKNISADPLPHFILEGGERCPFLEKSGLCRLILTLGEDSLCDICREHPRFYNEFSDRTEAGLGMCCEEAVSLLLNGRKALNLVCLDDGTEEEPGTEEERLFKQREEIFSLLSRETVPLRSCMEDCASLCGVGMPRLDMVYWADFYMGLERLDPAWTKALILLKSGGREWDVSRALCGVQYRRVMEYFVYRHFAAAGSFERAADMLRFSILSTLIVCRLENLGMELKDALRLYSSEIEYSDENIDLILNKIRE